MKKRFYIVFVARDEDGRLSKVPVPLHYAYIFVAAAVVGLFTITGMAGSYSRMLLKTAHFNQMREDREALRKDYHQLEQVAHEKDVQAASLGSLASEVSALYGLRQSKLSSPAAQVKETATAQLSAGTTPVFTEASYTKSLDQLYALRSSAMNGSAARALSMGLASDSSLSDWAALAAAPSLWPIQGQVTSSFGEREDPFNGEGAFHSGIDIGASYGTPVHATADGTIEKAGMANGYGREVLINHGHGVSTLYGHLSGFTVMAGQTVVRGQVIGYVGSSGRSTGAHLHYEVRIHDTPVNPHKYLRMTFQQFASSGYAEMNRHTGS
ncbi:MAG: M23 family metallopeptidase [Acidobacteriaceae bacterium]